MINEYFTANDYHLGEVGGRRIVNNRKIYSYYGVMTDSLFATLYYYHQRKHSDRLNPLPDLQSTIKALALDTSQFTLLADDATNHYQLYLPVREDADRYVFYFLLSRSIRHQVYNNLLLSLTKMKGIKDDSLVDQINILLSTANNAQSRSQFEASLTAFVDGLSINHDLEAMVIEMSHAFNEPNFKVESLFTSINEAVLSLYCQWQCMLYLFPLHSGQILVFLVRLFITGLDYYYLMKYRHY